MRSPPSLLCPPANSADLNKNGDQRYASSWRGPTSGVKQADRQAQFLCDRVNQYAQQQAVNRRTECNNIVCKHQCHSRGSPDCYKFISFGCSVGTVARTAAAGLQPVRRAMSRLLPDGLLPEDHSKNKSANHTSLHASCGHPSLPSSSLSPCLIPSSSLSTPYGNLALQSPPS